MIGVPYPHMVLNSHNVPAPDYKMYNSWKVEKGTSVEAMISNIAAVARHAPGGRLSTLIFNSHGEPGRIKIGAHITRADVAKFNVLKSESLVDRIWVVACRVALIDGGGSDTDGNYFCYRLAQESGAFVRASTDYQKIMDIPFYDDVPYGYIDEWEGDVYVWDITGKVVAKNNVDYD